MSSETKNDADQKRLAKRGTGDVRHCHRCGAAAAALGTEGRFLLDKQELKSIPGVYFSKPLTSLNRGV
jgi:hypothetical protein